MNRHDLVLASLATAVCVRYTSVQVQKLFFLIDKKAEVADGPHFNFEPYSYGPFDAAVYHQLDDLASEGLVNIEKVGTRRVYCLTNQGWTAGKDILNDMPVKTQGYIKKLSEFVISLSFVELVSAIYKAYPEMRENSVFQG